jgi:hypothetical protein
MAGLPYQKFFLKQFFVSTALLSHRANACSCFISNAYEKRREEKLKEYRLD